MDSAAKPSVLMACFTYTNQPKKVLDPIAEVLRDHGCDVTFARIELSLLSLLSYLGKGDYEEKYLGVKIPPTTIQDYHLDQARQFGSELAARATAASS